MDATQAEKSIDNAPIV